TPRRNSCQPSPPRAKIAANLILLTSVFASAGRRRNSSQPDFIDIGVYERGHFLGGDPVLVVNQYFTLSK
ncbi:MAG: hypothetical protein AAGE52_32220, partial [Myxococcota bacterium]